MKRAALWAVAAVLLMTAVGLIAANARREGQRWAYDEPAPMASRPKAGPKASAPVEAVNVNTADLAQLCTINGVGETLGQAILDERERNGPFHYPADLLNVKGIGDKTLQKLLPQLTLGGDAP